MAREDGNKIYDTGLEGRKDWVSDHMRKETVQCEGKQEAQRSRLAQLVHTPQHPCRSGGLYVRVLLHSRGGHATMEEAKSATTQRGWVSNIQQHTVNNHSARRQAGIEILLRRVRRCELESGGLHYPLDVVVDSKH